MRKAEVSHMKQYILLNRKMYLMKKEIHGLKCLSSPQENSPRLLKLKINKSKIILFHQNSNVCDLQRMLCCEPP